MPDMSGVPTKAGIATVGHSRGHQREIRDAENEQPRDHEQLGPHGLPKFGDLVGMFVDKSVTKGEHGKKWPEEHAVLHDVPEDDSEDLQCSAPAG